MKAITLHKESLIKILKEYLNISELELVNYQLINSYTFKITFNILNDDYSFLNSNKVFNINNKEISLELNLEALRFLIKDINIIDLYLLIQKYGYIKINEELDFYEIWFKDKENKLYLDLLNSNLNFEFSKHSENITKTKIYKSNIYK